MQPLHQSFLTQQAYPQSQPHRPLGTQQVPQQRFSEPYPVVSRFSAPQAQTLPKLHIQDIDPLAGLFAGPLGNLNRTSSSNHDSVPHFEFLKSPTKSPKRKSPTYAKSPVRRERSPVRRERSLVRNESLMKKSTSPKKKQIEDKPFARTSNIASVATSAVGAKLGIKSVTVPAKKIIDSSVKTIQISPQKPRKKGGERVSASITAAKRVSATVINQRVSAANERASQKPKKVLPYKNANGEWIKTEPTKQDEISANVEEFKKRFEGYVEITPDLYATIQPDNLIRYMKYNPNSRLGYDYRSGGIVVKNKYPDYWILKPSFGHGGKSWCVPLQSRNRYFRKDPKAIKSTHVQKQNLYQAVKDGKMVLMSREEFDEIQSKLEMYETREAREKSRDTHSTIKSVRVSSSTK